LDRIAQLLPFHASVSARSGGGFPPIAVLKYAPAAVQALGSVQDTPARELLIGPAGLGTVWSDQDVPFHPSASDTVVPERFV
jgi:hypothetical protein